MNSPFVTDLQKFQYFDKYSRYRYDLGRREHWHETVRRTIDYLKETVEKRNASLPNSVWDRLYNGIYSLDVMPSMRNLAMAGQAAARQNACSYNCSYAPIEDLYIFYEAVIILMSGSGFGYSVESRYIDNLPPVAERTGVVDKIVVEDTTEGWASAIHSQIAKLIKGIGCTFDYSLIRPAGTPLKIKGGRASGPEHLRDANKKIEEVILRRQGQKLRAIDVHDIMCHIAAAIVSGGVRRSAMIALFDFDDPLMRSCKSGENITGNEQRWYANNSAVWERELSGDEVVSFMTEMIDSQRGEPGIFNRYAANLTKPERRETAVWGTNPCAEIVLRPYQFCNLTSVVCRPGDKLDDLLTKVELATILGTIQSMSDYFPGLRKEWVKNAEEERLLGVDLNGIMDNKLARDPGTLAMLKEHSVFINKIYATHLGINQSAAITCVKPSGNSSTMLDTAPGMHTRWSKYYIRRAQVMAQSPIRYLLEDSGVPLSPQNGQTVENARTYVIPFPVKSPDESLTRNDLTALEQCNLWLLLKKNFTEHNPSVTITYRDHEVDDLINWVIENQLELGGMAFLPRFEARYAQMPYEDIDEATYKALRANLPHIRWEDIPMYENGTDMTNVSDTYACTSDKCEVSFV